MNCNCVCNDLKEPAKYFFLNIYSYNSFDAIKFENKSQKDFFY